MKIQFQFLKPLLSGVIEMEFKKIRFFVIFINKILL